KSAGAGGESGEMMIPPVSPGEGELVHMTCAQKKSGAPWGAPDPLSTLQRLNQPVAARGARLRELRWKNSAWLATAETIAGWNGFEIRNAGSGRSPVRKRSG